MSRASGGASSSSSSSSSSAAAAAAAVAANLYMVKQDEIAFVDKPSQNLLCPVCTERTCESLAAGATDLGRRLAVLVDARLTLKCQVRPFGCACVRACVAPTD